LFQFGETLEKWDGLAFFIAKWRKGEIAKFGEVTQMGDEWQVVAKRGEEE
jgi:hypothetical protein